MKPISKINKFEADLESEIRIFCNKLNATETLIWLLERQKTYLGRWLGFLSLETIDVKSLIENDYFLAIKVCNSRIGKQLSSVSVGSAFLYSWTGFNLAIHSIVSECNVSNAHVLDILLNEMISEVRSRLESKT